jgi:hypothetical protein
VAGISHRSRQENGTRKDKASVNIPYSCDEPLRNLIAITHSQFEWIGPEIGGNGAALCALGAGPYGPKRGRDRFPAARHNAIRRANKKGATEHRNPLILQY